VNEGAQGRAHGLDLLGLVLDLGLTRLIERIRERDDTQDLVLIPIVDLESDMRGEDLGRRLHRHTTTITTEDPLDTTTEARHQMNTTTEEEREEAADAEARVQVTIIIILRKKCVNERVW
jgi:hypothetical protein